MANTDPYNPADSAAAATNSAPKREIKPAKTVTPPVKGISHGAVPKGSTQPKTKIPLNVSADASGFPGPTDPYWKSHPILTEHKDGTVRQWGEDTVADKNQNTLPKQMMPPTLGKPVGAAKKDYYEGHSTPGSGYMRYHQ